MKYLRQYIRRIIKESIRDMRYDTALELLSTYINATWIWPHPGDMRNPLYNQWDRLEKSINLPRLGLFPEEEISKMFKLL